MDFPDDDDLLSVIDDLDEHISTQLASPQKENIESPRQTHIDCLKTKFGHTQFRPSQWRIIRSILEERRDNCAVMSTGYGKSLCFQFPSVYTNGITFVVSPLISLMQDQVLALTVAKIPACFLGSAQTDKSIVDGVTNGDYRLVYASPEYLGSCLEWLESLADRITLIAIDEAHCVSQWGHDFRNSYRTLGRIRKRIPNVPILAVTATATQRVRTDICTSLELRNPQMVCTGFDRPNLEFIVRPKSSVWEDLRPFVSGMTAPRGSIIVYCLTRKMVELVSQTLKMYGVECGAYHAGMPLSRRQDIHERFVRDKLQIIVATIAFGMGIDKPDVRLVIHYGASKDIESYYQEVGRAGRDGLLARCVMFQSDADFDTHIRLLGLSRLSAKVENNMTQLSTEMKKFVRSDQCRRLNLLKYFEGPLATCSPRIDCCDNCSRPKVLPADYEGMNADGEFDFTEDATFLLQAIDLFNGYAGLSKPISVLRGSQSQSIKRYHQHVLHGRGKFKSDAYWKQLAEMLESEEFSSKALRSLPGGFPYSVVELSRKGTNWLNNGRPLWLKPNRQMLQYMHKKRVVPVVDLPNLRVPGVSNQERLVNALMECRTTLATRFDVMPYMITSNLALEQIAKIQPLNLIELRAANIDGMSEAKIIQFGSELIKCVLQHKNFLAHSELETVSKSMVSILHMYPMLDVRVTDSHLRLLPLIAADADINRLCVELGLKESTIITYLTILIKGGHPVRLSYIEKITKLSALGSAAILAALPKNDDALMNMTLRPLKESLPSYLQYDQIKLVLAYAQVRHHLKSLQLPFDDPDVEAQPQEEARKVDNVVCVDDEIDEIEDDVNLLELLEDMNLPMPETNSQNTNLSSDQPHEVDLGSDFESDMEKPSTKNVADSEPKVVVEKTKLKSKRSPPKVLPNKRIKYDSDSDEERSTPTSVTEQPVTSVSRKLPSWMLQKPPSPTVVSRKKSSFL